MRSSCECCVGGRATEDGQASCAGDGARQRQQQQHSICMPKIMAEPPVAAKHGPQCGTTVRDVSSRMLILVVRLPQR